MTKEPDPAIKAYREGIDAQLARARKEPAPDFKAMVDLFAEQIPANGSILEIGSASGGDARYLASKNFKITCTDVVPEVLTTLSAEGFETEEYDFRSSPKFEWIDSFDGVFANTSLLHAPRKVFERALEHVALVLKKEGVATFTLKTSGDEKIPGGSIDSSGQFTYYSEKEIRQILDKHKFKLLHLSFTEGGKCLHVVVKPYGN